MKGVDRDGRAVEKIRRTLGCPVPRGPLHKGRVLELRATIARGLSAEGFSSDQIGQVLKGSGRSMRDYLAGASPASTECEGRGTDDDDES